jgi:hypothetical protein
MTIESELDQQHRAATVDYVRAEEVLQSRQLDPNSTTDDVIRGKSLRDAALERLNAVRDVVLARHNREIRGIR